MQSWQRWYFHIWRYQVFARKLTWYFIGVYIINNSILDVIVIIKRGQRGKDQNKRKHATSKNCLTLFLIVACEHALRESLAAGREKEEELATTSWNLNVNWMQLVWSGWGKGKPYFPLLKLAKRQRRPLGQSVSTNFVANCSQWEQRQKHLLLSATIKRSKCVRNQDKHYNHVW